jgi:PAS domain S-box-containing protein
MKDSNPSNSSETSFRSLQFDFSAVKALLSATNRYRTLFESAADAIFVFETNGNMLDVNRIACDLLGYPRKEIMKMNWSDILAPEERVRGSDLFQEIFERGHILFETSYSRNDGKIIPIESSSRIIEYDQQKAVLNIARDITERKEAEKDRERLWEQLRHAQKMEAIGTLAGGIAHDFNNILTPISGYTELALLNLPKEHMVRQYLEEVLEAIKRAKSLVAQILTFSRQKKQEKIPIRIAPILKEALKLMRATIPSTIEIRQDIQDCGQVLADPTQIHQVIVNLCTNANHAMKEKGGILTVRLKEIESGKEHAENPPVSKPRKILHLSVNDTGLGMSPEVMQRIFEPYFTTKGEGEGTGLGLSVVHGIVKSHGGEIHVASEPGKGSSFSIFFPLIESEVTDEVTVSHDPVPRGTERILIVDDEDSVAEVIAKMLMDLGYKVAVMTDSRRALSLIQKKSEALDLILTDLTMPKTTGIQLAEEISKFRPELPIVLVTGNRKAIDEEITSKCPIRGILLKPVQLEDLGRMVREVLDNRQEKDNHCEPS